ECKCGAARLGRRNGQGVEGDDLDPARRIGDCRRLRAQHLDPLLGGKQRPLARMHADADDKTIDHARRPGDDVAMPVGDGIERSRGEADAFHVHPRAIRIRRPQPRASPSLASLPLSAGAAATSSEMRSTETTFSLSSVLKMRTPWVLRAAMRTSSTGQRMSFPPSVTSMIWSDSSTGNEATSRPLRSLTIMATMP